MKRVYIYNDYQLSSGNGVGIFLEEFTRCATKWGDNVRICMVMFRTNVEEFCIHTRDELDFFFIPRKLCKNPFKECGSIISILKKYIVDAKDTFFLFNYAPSDKLMFETHKYFPLSKQICIIHDFNWTAPLLGNVDLFRDLIAKTRVGIPSQHIGIMNLYQQEVKQYHIANHVICLSEDSRSILQNYYFVPKEKITLIPHGIDTIKKGFSAIMKQKWRENYHLDSNEKVILMVGRICKAKGMFAYLNAFKKVLKRDSNCRLVIAGELCNAPDLLDATDKVTVKITLTGMLDKDKLSYWYRMADIGVIPSYSEQCSYVGLEMMSYGLPVVASDGFGVRCMFRDEINTLTASIGNRNNPEEFEQNLADSTLCLLNNAKLRKKLKKNARQILQKKYSFSEMEKQYKAIFMA